jgi:hypothetical protein
MGKKKTENTEQLLTHNIIVRVTEVDYNKYDQLCEKSDCTSVAEVVRRILAGRQIILFHKDASMDGPMEILTGIQKDLKAIGNNINQVTRAYHSSRFESQQIYQVQKALQEHQKIETKVSLLLSVISQLSEQWLQK